jgi:hypothetical protein
MKANPQSDCNYSNVAVVLAAPGDELWRIGRPWLEHQMRQNAHLACPHSYYKGGDYKVPDGFKGVFDAIQCDESVKKVVHAIA